MGRLEGSESTLGKGNCIQNILYGKNYFHKNKREKDSSFEWNQN